MPVPPGPHGPDLPENPSAPDPLPRDPLPRRPGRIHIAARQRRTDLTAVGALALHLPHVALSVALVLVLSYALDVLVSGPPWWLLFGGWALSGALAFHPPFERLLARRLFGLRHPTPEEARLLHAVWREVTARSGVDGRRYQLWVEESDDINAMAAAGHIVAVTSHSLASLPPPHLAGVLAHELGHHVRGHAWVSLFVFWYALPGRLAWQLLLRAASHVERLSVGAAAAVIAAAGAVLLALATATYGLILLPLITPYLAASLSRRSELRADEHAAGLGFGEQLMVVLRADLTCPSPGAAPRKHGEEQRLMTRLLDSHPDVHTRLHHLQAYVDRRP
ncbi:M48 family metalloprotease [Streptomyces sp. NPDC102406]|uniref:M48 family metalloprotease n=1 Tax=Streptomyces sp. NPDC102406 TaxID=3366171 RepID=UPI00381B6210